MPQVPLFPARLQKVEAADWVPVPETETRRMKPRHSFILLSACSLGYFLGLDLSAHLWLPGESISVQPRGLTKQRSR